ncbi:hypothetical protein [Acinetobacter soli]|nr:hypothetical protein [Acinetobacter soli]MCF3128433.1 hypothetical protein [Acinetobacter soli]
MNKALFYTHRCMMVLYAMMLVLAWIIFIQHGKSDTITVLILLTAIYGGMFFLHLKASNEVKNGTEVGKTLSQGLGCLLLLGFPIGTVVGVFILINTRKKKWQTGAL